jgi:hypothetical protein
MAVSNAYHKSFETANFLFYLCLNLVIQVGNFPLESHEI